LFISEPNRQFGPHKKVEAKATPEFTESDKSCESGKGRQSDKSMTATKLLEASCQP
jgi:hypothetical protein